MRPILQSTTAKGAEMRKFRNISFVVLMAVLWLAGGVERSEASYFDEGEFISCGEGWANYTTGGQFGTCEEGCNSGPVSGACSNYCHNLTCYGAACFAQLGNCYEHENGTDCRQRCECRVSSTLLCVE